MNRIARTTAHLVASTGLALGALAMTGTAAHAETPPAPKPGPVLGLGPADPGQPTGPDTLGTPTPSPQPPAGPKNLGTPKPKPQPPSGPKDLGNPAPDPVVDPAPSDPAGPAHSSDPTHPAKASKPAAPVAPVSETTEDAPTQPAVDVPAAQDDPTVAASPSGVGSHGHELAWILSGTGLGLAGLALVAVRRRRQAAEA